MIRRSISYVERFVDQVLDDQDKGDTPEDKGYILGSKDVALNVKEGLEGLEDLYSLYEPFGSDWMEIATSNDSNKIEALAIAYSRSLGGSIELRFEGAGNNVYKIVKERDLYYRRSVTGGVGK